MPEASEFERINGLLERAIPSGRPRGVPLLFVHGMWGGSWYWVNYMMAAAQAGWDAWAINLRGHHGSRPVPDLGRVSVLDYVQDVRDCLRGLGEVILVGHSMGGLIAQKVAESGGVRAAVALTSAAPRWIPTRMRSCSTSSLQTSRPGSTTGWSLSRGGQPGSWPWG